MVVVFATPPFWFANTIDSRGRARGGKRRRVGIRRRDLGRRRRRTDRIGVGARPASERGGVERGRWVAHRRDVDPDRLVGRGRLARTVGATGAVATSRR